MRRARIGRPRLPSLSVVFVAAVVLAGAAWVGAQSSFGGAIRPLSSVNGFLYDAAIGVLSVFRSSEPWPRTALVLIDQRTLASPAWSGTPRALQQPQLGRLGRQILDLGAQKVGFDLVLAFDPADLRGSLAAPPSYDEALVGLLTDRADDVVLGSDAALGIAPRYAALLGPASLGVIDLQTETDGIVRSAAGRLRMPEGAVAFGFASALARDAAGAALGAGRAFLVPNAPIDRIPHLSAAQVEDCLGTDAGTAKLRRLFYGRIIVVGAALLGEDEHRGPDRYVLPGPAPNTDKNSCGGTSERVSGREAGHIPGAFLQAAAVEGFLSTRPIALAGTPLRVAANLAIAAVGLLLRSLVARMALVPMRRGPLLGTTARALVAVPVGLAVLLAAAVAFDAAGLMGSGLWLPIGTTVEAIAVLGVAQILASALRRDLALVDLRIAFGRWLPRPVVEAAMGETRTVLHGQERTITVLIADLNNFTPFCAAHRSNPEEIVSALNQKFSAAQAVVDAHGGCLDKFVGDALIAFWNGIDDQPDHARRAIAAAVDIVESDRRDTRSALTFKCAVATGIAFVGRYGSEHKSNFSAIGEPMNLAARLESVCRSEKLDVVIAEATVEASRAVEQDRRDTVSLRRAGEAALKGFVKPIAFYTVARQGFVPPRKTM